MCRANKNFENSKNWKEKIIAVVNELRFLFVSILFMHKRDLMSKATPLTIRTRNILTVLTHISLSKQQRRHNISSEVFSIG